MNILYVEDNPLDAGLTRLTLAKQMPNATLTVVETLAAAMDALEDPAAFDIVLCDLRLPDGSGLDMLTHIRQQHIALPVVLLTGLGDEDTAVAALKAGADDYIVKRDGYMEKLPLLLPAALARFHAKVDRYAGGVRVLYVEHNTADADLSQRYLARRAPHIMLAVVHTADDALKQLPLSPADPCPWDVLLLDYRLPGLNALETLKIVCTERRLDIPVVLITGKGDEELAVQALRLGATDYLVKREGYLIQLPHALENAFHLAQLERERNALRKSEAHYRRFFENDLTADFVIDMDGKLLDCNPAFTQLFGFETFEQALATDIIHLLPDSNLRTEMSSEINAHGKIEKRELVLQKIDGEQIFAVLTALGHFDDDGKLTRVQGYLFDITERKHIEEQFYQSQKMEALGHLAGGVAHDFNNLLVPILGYAEMGMRNDVPGGRFYADFKRIKDAAEHAADLTRQILAFSRRQVLEVATIDLNTVVKRFHTMLQRLVSENIILHMDLAADLHPIKGDKTQLEQILLNLVVNARDAMPDGGDLIIKTENIRLDETYSTTHSDVQPGNYVLLAVSDTGFGMDAETQKHIFEPFFSTKKRGAGTGLGLSTVFGIVKQHGGNILVYSEPEHGTSFKVYLPATEATELTETTCPVERSNLYGSETVLVVEDNEDVRRLVTTAIASFGYHVLQAAGPIEGIAVAKNHINHIDLLLTDVIMPAMNGYDLHQKLAAIQPNLRVLYMSGYTDDIISHQKMLPSRFHFVQKPFDIEKLLVKIREALSEN